MRRGLIRWDADELPMSVLRERVHRLQSAMGDARFDAIILYTNFIRCAAVSWLTGFSPYWGDGIVVVTREGQPLPLGGGRDDRTVRRCEGCHAVLKDRVADPVRLAGHV